LQNVRNGWVFLSEKEAAFCTKTGYCPFDCIEDE